MQISEALFLIIALSSSPLSVVLHLYNKRNMTEKILIEKGSPFAHHRYAVTHAAKSCASECRPYIGSVERSQDYLTFSS